MSAYQCNGCGYTYTESEGDTREGYAPGTTMEALPENFTCPDCGVRYKEDFVPL